MRLQLSFSMFLLSGIPILFGNSVGAEDAYKVVGEYRYLGDNLYEKGDELFFVTERVIKTQESKRPRYELIYLKRFSFFDEDKKQLDPLLAELIDRDSWRQISKFFYRDKSKLYCFSPSPDGGYLNHEEGTLSVFLEGVSCRNQKDYFFIGPSYVNNAGQLIAMVLAAKAAGQRVRFFEDSGTDTVNRYVRGVRISA